MMTEIIAAIPLADCIRINQTIANQLPLSDEQRWRNFNQSLSKYMALQQPNTSLPTPDPKTAVTNRRAASAKRVRDVMEGPHPVVTQSGYRSVIQNQGAEVNLKIKRLCQMKNLLSNFMLVADAALRDYNPQVAANKGREEEVRATYQALRGQRDKVEKLWKTFPLRVE